MKVASLFLAAASLVSANGGFNLAQEHAGGLFGHAHSSTCCVHGVLHNGNSTGQVRTVGNESLYLAYPPGRHPNTTFGILYLTDIFGIQLLNNRLLADSIAKAGYFVVAPDLFRGDPVPADALSNPDSTFNMTAWSLRHPQSDVESIIESALDSMRTEFGVSKIGGTGYCYGGRYVARFLAAGRGLEVGFAAHPSGWQTSEWEAVAGPISIAFGALDTINTADNRTTIEAIFQNGNKTYETALYANAEHGFAVRTDLSIKTKAFAQESAYFQLIRWLDAWLKGYED